MPSLGLGLGTHIPSRVLGGFSAEAQNYFDRVVAAGGTVNSKDAIATYIDALVDLGGAYWDNMLSSCLFVGVSFEGCFVPLRDGMTVPTNNNFISADQDSTTGLTGDGSTKNIALNINQNLLGVNDHALSVYLSSNRGNGSKTYVAGGFADLRLFENVTGSRVISAGGSTVNIGNSTQTGFIGFSRDNSADFDWIDCEQSGTAVNASSGLASLNMQVYSVQSINYLAAELATYTVGPSVDLSVLRNLQDTLIAAV